MRFVRVSACMRRPLVYIYPSMTLASLLLAALLSVVGCVAPPNAVKVKESRKETPATVPTKPAEKEEVSPPKQEALAAVEEFLSRTQEYRLPEKAERQILPDSPAPAAVSDKVHYAVNAPPASMQPRDAAIANAQISVGDPVVLVQPPPPQAIPAIESVSIRSKPAKTPTTLLNPKMTNSALELQTRNTEESVDSLISSLKEELKVKNDVATEWKLRTLLIALERDAEEAAIPDTGSPELKGILPAWGSAAAALRSYIRNPANGAETAIERVEALKGLLSASLGPRVKSLALCRKVSTYGSYEEMASDEFVSGRSIQTIVYAEIENLRATPESSGTFETKLSTRLEVLTAEGESMWQREEPEVVDRCRRARRDFFVAQRITLPATLPVGEYVLKFSVEDKASEMLSETSVPFSLRSPISVAKGQ